MIYLCAFFASCFMLWLYEHGKSINRITNRIIIFIAILIPCLLAAFRDYSIGTDLTEYGISVFNACTRASKFSDLQYLYDWYGIETGYRLLNFLISRFTDKAWILLFVIQALELFLVLSFFVYIKEKISNKYSVSFCMLCFYLLFYNETLNLIRQSLAMAIIIFGCRYLFSDKKLKLLLCILIAMQFHMTAILGICIYVLYYLIVRSKMENVVKTIIYFFSIICAIMIPWLLQKFFLLNYFNGKYANRYAFEGKIPLTITQLIIRVPFFCVLLYQAQRKKRNRFSYLFYSLMLLIDLVFAELRSIDATLYRLSLYFSWLKPWIYFEIACYYNKKYKKIVMLGTIIFLIALWIYQIVYQGNGETFPYLMADVF